MTIVCFMDDQAWYVHMVCYMIIRKNKLLTKGMSWQSLNTEWMKSVRKDQIFYHRYLYGRYKVRNQTCDQLRLAEDEIEC